MFIFFKNIINFCILLFVKIFTSNKIRFGANLHPSTLKFLLKNKIKKVDFSRAYIGGNQVFINDGVKFYEDPIIFGKVKIGRYTSINGPSTRICSAINTVEIGSYCSIASNVIIQEYYHNVDLVTTYSILSNIFKKSYSKLQITSKGSIVISDDVWIGSNAVILSGVKIGRGAIIGAGSVVTKDVAPYSINAGNPSKLIKMRFKEEDIFYIENSKWWEWSVEQILENEDFFTKIYNLND